MLTLWREAMLGQHGGDTRSIVDNVNNGPKRSDGNTRSYTLARLKAERYDLFKRVKAGELTANAAAIEAAFKERTATFPLEPAKLAVAIVRRLGRKEATALARALAREISRVARALT